MLVQGVKIEPETALELYEACCVNVKFTMENLHEIVRCREMRAMTEKHERVQEAVAPWMKPIKLYTAVLQWSDLYVEAHLRRPFVVLQG
eukprot:4214164-Prorocentrum_lima.AAC.1